MSYRLFLIVSAAEWQCHIGCLTTSFCPYEISPTVADAQYVGGGLAVRRWRTHVVTPKWESRWAVTTITRRPGHKLIAYLYIHWRAMYPLCCRIAPPSAPTADTCAQHLHIKLTKNSQWNPSGRVPLWESEFCGTSQIEHHYSSSVASLGRHGLFIISGLLRMLRQTTYW